MVQVVRAPQQRPSSAEAFASGLGQSLPQAMGLLLQNRQQEQERARQQNLLNQENRSLQSLGIDLSGVTSPKAREILLEQGLKQQAEEETLRTLGLLPPSLEAKQSLLGEQKTTRNFPRAGLIGEEPISTTEQPLKEFTPEQKRYISLKHTQAAAQIRHEEEFQQKQKLAEEKAAREEKKFKQTQDIAERDYNLKVHGLSEDYAKKLREKADISKNRLGVIEKSKEALKKTKTGALTLQNYFKTAYKDTPLENIALSPQGAIIEASIPSLLEGNKDIYGVRLSDRDLAVSLGKTISLGKSNEVNMAILEFNEEMDRLRINKQKVADQIIKENNGLRPLNFEGLVDQRFDEEYGDEIEHSLAKAMKDSGSGLTLMRAPDGRLLNVPPEKVEEFKALKAKVL